MENVKLKIALALLLLTLPATASGGQWNSFAPGFNASKIISHNGYAGSLLAVSYDWVFTFNDTWDSPAHDNSGIQRIARASGASVYITGFSQYVSTSAFGTPIVNSADTTLFMWNGSGWDSFPTDSNVVGYSCFIGLAGGGDYSALYGLTYLCSSQFYPSGYTDHQIQKWNQATRRWDQVGGGGGKGFSGISIAVSPDNVLWYVDASGNIYRVWPDPNVGPASVNSQRQGWQLPFGVAAFQVAVGPNNTAYFLDRTVTSGGRKIFRLSGNSWVQVPGMAWGIAVAPDTGLPWVLDGGGNIAYWSGSF